MKVSGCVCINKQQLTNTHRPMHDELHTQTALYILYRYMYMYMYIRNEYMHVHVHAPTNVQNTRSISALGHLCLHSEVHRHGPTVDVIAEHNL